MNINDSQTVQRIAVSAGTPEGATAFVLSMPAIPDLLHNTGDVFILTSLLTHCILTKDIYLQTIIRMPAWIFLTIVCSNNLRLRDDRYAILQEIFRLGIIFYYALKLNFKLDIFKLIYPEWKRRKGSLTRRGSEDTPDGFRVRGSRRMLTAKVATVAPEKREVLSEEELQRFYKGVPTLLKGDGSVNYCSMPYDKLLEISYAHFTANNNHGSHEGCFRRNNGITFQGMINHCDKKFRASIKTNISGDLEGMKGLMKEVKLLKYVGQHDNLQTLFGACTKDISNGKIFLVLENCGNRTLSAHLQELQKTENNLLMTESVLPEDLLIDFYRWAYEISSGMKFISSKNIVHGMLTCDCILINEVGTVKLTDYGTAPYLFDSEKFKPEEWDHDSWKYLAPEAIIKNSFTTSGDVYSFSVVLWKTFTIFSDPFPSFGAKFSKIFSLSLLDGMRPDADERIPTYIYELLSKCWLMDPLKRPSFDMCCQYLYVRTKPKRRIVTCDGDFIT